MAQVTQSQCVYVAVALLITLVLVATTTNSMVTDACKISEFACRGGSLCLPLDKYCDGRDDCGDASDEPKMCTGKWNDMKKMKTGEWKNMKM